ncbi:MAG: hypothetical protein AAGE94_21505, partial [Acidobacteriota bacterium]
PPPELATTLWGVRFRSPLTNAAGMFKTGEGYATVAAQGAGGHLIGTTTATPRRGNRKCGVPLPFAPYPRSGAASNWLGLPNPGHAAVARHLERVSRIDGCPIGASLSADPDPKIPTAQKLEDLAVGLHAYARAGVDFIEINESCPNTEAVSEDGRSAFQEMVERLSHVATRFLATDDRPPVIVKFSNDTDPAQVADLLDVLVDLGFDGVNFGNTSTAYGRLRDQIEAADRPLYDYFTTAFGGGVSGRPLRDASLRLVEAARQHLDQRVPEHEFHIVRTGGVETAADVRASLDAGASLVQWYSGYFEAFARQGHAVYARLYAELADSSA